MNLVTILSLSFSSIQFSSLLWRQVDKILALLYLEVKLCPDMVGMHSVELESREPEHGTQLIDPEWISAWEVKNKVSL